ncbi:sushi domain-containing protein 1 isoform X2 [Bufo bufo]|uniref:sushi domain-containing protein 1 isoform X2 n=1 Tax=Bufo bufo TaxID=8384 RepID=UPI001ABE21E5|nr:sushi domain-containing protein 1 isoform X2 [Bufo bufo]
MRTQSTVHLVLLEACLLLLFCTQGFTALLSRDLCNSCHQNATCIEKDNKYSCMCNFGLIGNGRTHCLDKDECQMGAHKICGEHTACHNTHGSYYCICLKGYLPSNNHENFIPNDGTFCVDLDECEDPDICGVNAKCKNIPGSYECYCKEGFGLQNGSGPFQANGAQSLCKEVDCGPPPSRLNSAMILSTKTTFGSQVTYTCTSGFGPDHGVSTSVCTASGIWKGATVSCTDIDECEVSETCGINSVCKNLPGSFKCSCKEGYKLQNSKNTSQSSLNFTCQAVDCDQPPVLPDTEMVLSGATTFSNQVTYTCISGFFGYGHNTSVCNANGTWEGATLVCTAIDCGPPVAMLNTEIHRFNSTTFGSSVTYICAKGFISVGGYNSSVCTDAGHWEGANLDCRGKAAADCGPPPSFNYTKKNEILNTTYGSTVQFQCLHGFVMDSKNKTATCNANGEWVGDSIVCREIDCGQPPLLSNVIMKWNGATNLGSEVRYTCQKGFYNPEIWHVSRCTLNETWENITFSCTEVDCGMPFLIEHADWTWTNRTTLGSYVYYHCKPGFNHNGRKNFSVCLENGTWEGLNMTCSVKEDLISSLSIFNETCLQWHESTDISGWEILYKFSIYGIRWNDKDFVDKKSLNYTTDNDNPVVCLDLLPDTNYTVSMVAVTPTLPAIQLNITVETTMKQTFGDILVLNNTCLTWTRSSSARSPEVYTVSRGYVFIQGRTWSSVLLDSIMFNFSTDKVAPVLCLDLSLAAEYFVNITEPSTELSASTYINVTSDEVENSSKEHKFNETCLWWNRSLDGLQKIYKLYAKGERWSPKELFQDLMYKINTDHNISAICVDIPMDSQYINVTGAFSNLVSGEPIQNLTVFNETCLVWRRHFRSKELYVFFIYGYRTDEKSISHKLLFNLTTDEKRPVVCFELQKGINYTVDVVSAFYPQSPEQISIFTPSSDVLLPKLKIVPAHSQLPKINFQRSDRNGPISSYQVFVVPLVRRCSFTCESLQAVPYFNNTSKTHGYVTAEFFPKDDPDHLEFSIGDRQYYGEFYNAPLERGKDYCIILRTITKMKTQSCTVMAQIEELSNIRHHMAVVLLGSIAFVCFIVFISYSLARITSHSRIILKTSI